MNTERRLCSTDFDAHEDRRYYSADLRAQVALSAIKGEKSHAELAMEFAIHPNQVGLWKQQMLNNINRVFDNDRESVNVPKLVDNRHAKIGQLMAENDFLTRVLGH
jgi:transposase-like protein